jgi:pimeloyl-ACP methyl ester carboxylesterase
VKELDVALPTHRARVLAWGDPGAPLALALHGFPDTARCWRHLGPFLAGHGWRVAAPYLRGYAPSGIPADRAYTVGALMADAVALHRELGGDERAVLVGHDWGAITGNALAAHPGSPFARVVSLAVPPIPAMRPARPHLRTWAAAVVRQPRKSWYVAANQVPGLSERHWERLVTKLWRDWSPGYDATEDLAHLRAAVPDRAHATAVLSSYRAFLRPGPGAAAYREWQPALNREPRVPVRYLQGDRDGCLDRRFADLARHRVETVVVRGAGHFLQVERPDEVNRLVLEFLA